MGHEWLPRPVKQNGQQKRKRHYHQDNERFRIKYYGLVKNGCIKIHGRLHLLQAMRYQPPCEDAPVLVIKMRVELRGDDVRIRQ